MVKARLKVVAIAALLAVIAASCKQTLTKDQSTGKMSDNNISFPKGKKITNNNFAGDAWLNMLVENDNIYDAQIGSVTFAPGARTNWHSHPGGQILLVIAGKGLYREEGKPIRVIQKGDVIKCLPNVKHWHGATPTDSMVHIAISTNTDKGPVVWLEKVSDEEYSGP